MKLFRRFIEKMCPTLEFKKEKRKRKRRAPVNRVQAFHEITSIQPYESQTLLKEMALNQSQTN
jgi:hypothetical protein